MRSLCNLARDFSPLSVTRVRNRASVLRFFNPSRCTSPASVTFVFPSFSEVRAVRSLRCARPSSLTGVLVRRSSLLRARHSPPADPGRSRLEQDGCKWPRVRRSGCGSTLSLSNSCFEPTKCHAVLHGTTSALAGSCTPAQHSDYNTLSLHQFRSVTSPSGRGRTR